jgi:hypothetical protein
VARCLLELFLLFGMAALHKVGAIDKQAISRSECACLTPVQRLSLKQIKALREREQVRPNGIRELPQRHPESREQVGANRRATAGLARRCRF